MGLDLPDHQDANIQRGGTGLLVYPIGSLSRMLLIFNGALALRPTKQETPGYIGIMENKMDTIGSMGIL